MSDKAPLVRVELEYADGSIQRLTGPPAEAWLEDVNNVIITAHVRYGRGQLQDYPWEWTHKKSSGGNLSKFDGYEGTD